jgi:hypothetical protein
VEKRRRLIGHAGIRRRGGSVFGPVGTEPMPQDFSTFERIHARSLLAAPDGVVSL